MPEAEPKSIIPKPGDILTPQEAALLQRADRGELTCLCCGEPLVATKLVTDEYEDVVLYCVNGTCSYVAY